MTDMTSNRLLQKPKGSFFLFGPRATGKSTWVKKQCKPDYTIDLLKATDYQRFSKNLSLLSEIIDAHPNYKTVVIDEVQKLPELLDEVHSLIFESENKIQFILTGSNSRKLKSKNVNLLAGRAVVRNFHPFSQMEISEKFNLTECLKYGMLPEIWNLTNEEDRKDYLTAYVQTYLKEEIQQEAAVRSLPSYLSFLEHFALRNAQVINIQNISNEIGIARTTIHGYLDILEQTMLGFKLAPLHLKAKVKEVSTPKFYFFDTGVVRSLAQQLDESPKAEIGSLLETYILHEIKTFSDYFQKRWTVNFWGTPNETEVDFIISQGKNKIGIEVKSSTNWDKDFSKGLNTLLDSGKIKHAYGVYNGKDIIKKDNIIVYPVLDFIKKLYGNSFLSE